MIDHTNDKMKQSTELGTLILGPAPRNSKKKACNTEKDLEELEKFITSSRNRWWEAKKPPTD